MYKTFVFGDKEVAACANAALPYRYKQVFREDLLDFINKPLNPTDYMNLGGKVLYIMHNAAIKADMNSLNFDDYLTFLEGFTLGDILDQAQDILAFMYETTKASSQKKAIPGPQIDQ